MERDGQPPKQDAGGGDEGALPSKRRRTNVDYVALQKKLQVGMDVSRAVVNACVLVVFSSHR